MPINVDDARTVFRRPAARMEAPKTLAEYQATIIARFGHMPSWDKLAKIENAKAHASLNPQTAVNSKPAPERLTARQVAYKAVQAAKTEVFRQSIMDALVRPATAGDVSRRIKRDQYLTRRQLVIMEGLGLVKGERVKSMVVWRRAE